jgi:hypothetical protein
MITADDLQPTLKTLEGIVNSAVHPDIAIRAVMVELKPIRKEIIRLKGLVEKAQSTNGDELMFSKEPISLCCNARVQVKENKHSPHGPITGTYYVCDKCKMACDTQ